MALIQRVIAAQTSPGSAEAAPIRRCTFRRVTAIPRRRALPVYDVACLYPKRISPIPLGDLASARPICDGCTAQGIFRADED
ncbi:MAG TPA: hypothetical protein VK992_02660 [Candidatus Caenarcaniphilales bacterium]|nr:hypothetical protein [Candidatus Caenarcaniphilales bacterium]